MIVAVPLPDPVLTRVSGGSLDPGVRVNTSTVVFPHVELDIVGEYKLTVANRAGIIESPFYVNVTESRSQNGEFSEIGTAFFKFIHIIIIITETLRASNVQNTGIELLAVFQLYLLFCLGLFSC